MKEKAKIECLAHFHFGQGKLVVQNALVDGKPSIIVMESTYVGVPGELAPKKEPSADDPEVLKRSIIFSFPSEEHRKAVDDALVGIFK
jgi:hypothetical protein